MENDSDFCFIMTIRSSLGCIFLIMLLQVIPKVAFADTKVAKSILFLGDSLTEGLGVSPSEAYPALVETKLLAKGFVVRVVNSGVSGATTASGPSRMKWALKSKPDFVVLALGANDGLRGLPVADMKKNLESTIEIAKKAGCRVLLVGMKVPPNFGKEYGKKFEEVFSQIAKRDKAISYLPFLLERVGGEVELNQADGIHPNAKGHQIMAELLVKTLERIL